MQIPLASEECSYYVAPMTHAQRFLQEIEIFLVSSKMSPTRFGIEVLKDPSFVNDLRAEGSPRICNLRTIEKVEAFIRKKRAGHDAKPLSKN